MAIKNSKPKKTPSIESLRYFLQARIFIAYLLFPFLRVLAASVPMATALPMFLEENLGLYNHIFSGTEGLEKDDWVEDNLLLYLLRCFWVLELLFTILSSMHNFSQGTKIIQRETLNDKWTRSLEDCMDIFMFAGCSNLAINIVLMMSLRAQQLPHPIILAIICLLSTIMEAVASWFSHVLMKGIDAIYSKVNVEDPKNSVAVQVEADGNNNDDVEMVRLNSSSQYDSDYESWDYAPIPYL